MSSIDRLCLKAWPYCVLMGHECVIFRLIIGHDGDYSGRFWSVNILRVMVWNIVFYTAGWRLYRELMVLILTMLIGALYVE